ncbi:hypothetical protein CPB83DRAFT_856112 [Crepidotus variabilis]|uniref:Uncharacterized protein n=1 Tax=Crepidotus variabilis TaxID=179855 RepID=A0A9P6EDG1_9AGAR|nr:hypothetical protein CPB83DRAFT_856112 [Crepidotus variabilis]
MVQSIVILSALLAGPALAIPTRNYGARMGAPTLAPHRVFGREPGMGRLFRGVTKVAKAGLHIGSATQNQQRDLGDDDDLDLITREFMDDLEIDAREPFGVGLLLKGAAKVAKAALHLGGSRNQKRDLSDEDLDLITRDVMDEMEIDARDPSKVGNAFKKIGKGILSILIREDSYDELD